MNTTPGWNLQLQKTAFLATLPKDSTKPRPRDSLAKLGASSGPPPPLHIGQAEWDAAAQKLFPHESTEGPPLREACDPTYWQPTEKHFQEAICRLKKGRAADSGGWTTELAQSALSNPQVDLRSQMAAWPGHMPHPLPQTCLSRQRRWGVRPILISMIWTKLVSHMLLAQARPDLEPF